MKALTITFLLFAMSSCDDKEKFPASRFEVQHVTLTQVREVPDPPPPGFKSKFSSIEAWLSALADKDKPDSSIISYRFALFQSDQNFTLSLTGSKRYGHADTVSIDFEPSIMYYTVPHHQVSGLSYQQVIDTMTHEIQLFSRTSKFRNSFFGKAKEILDNKGRNLLE